MDLGKGSDDFQPDSCADPVLPSIPSILNSPDFFSSALQQAGVGTFHFDVMAGIVTFDAVAITIFGVSNTQMSISGLPLLHPYDRGTVERLLARRHPGDHQDVVFRIIRDDGQLRWVKVKGRIVESGKGGQGNYVGIVMDITEETEAAHSLRDAEERYRLISQVITDAVFEWDIVRDEIIWHDTIRPLFGNLVRQLSSINALRKYIHPDDQDRIRDEFVQLFANREEKYESDQRILSADGVYLDVHACGRVMYDPEGKPTRLIGSFRDVSASRRASLALRESEAVNRGIVEASDDNIVLLSLDGKVLFFSKSTGVDLRGEDFTSQYGEDWVSVWPGYAKPRMRSAIKTAAAGGRGRFTDRFDYKGRLRWMEITISPIRDDSGAPIRLVVFARDVTQRQEAAEKLRRAALFDSLTKLPNRAFFQESLTKSVDAMRSAGKRLGLLLLDVDEFKQVNDRLGHDAGDVLLKAIASRLQIASSNVQVVARLGGDEFAIFLEDIEGEAELSFHAQAVLDRMREPLLHEGRVLDCRVTVGGAIFPDDGDTPEELLKSADIALYVGKEAGRGHLSIFRPKHRVQMRERVEMVATARSALRDNRVFPYYQPQCALTDRSVQGFEALLRWEDSRGGVQLPADIAAAFEDFDVATQISRTMFDLVIGDMREWLDQGVAFGHIAINAGEVEFRRDGFAEFVLEQLHKAQIPPRLLQLEVTETVFLGHGADFVERALRILDGEGVRIALDDFGTGYASLRHLKQFPVHVMKIDRGFVKGMHNNAEDVAIISAVLNLGKRLGLDVIAEGIETAKQAARLRRLGCEYGQGFLYSAAVPASAVPGLIKSSQLLAKDVSLKPARSNV